MGGSSSTARDPLVIALDRIPSDRIYDQDGHLHVAQVHITKAGVSPYYGHEIPHWEELGLKSDKIYRLLRDPAELERAAATLHNKPLLFGHKPVHAEDHDHQMTVGTVSKPTWNAPYIDGDMACWVQQAIDCVKNDTQKELSSAYHYKAVMTPGVYEGEAFDGRMVNISFNHVALVPKGRVGPDCVVSDSAETVIQHLTAAATAAEKIVAAQAAGDVTNGRAGSKTSTGAFSKGTLMRTKVALRGAASTVRSAFTGYAIAKNMAQDSAVDFTPLVADITKQNFKNRKPVLALALRGALSGKIAADADLDDVEQMLDAVEEAVEDLKDTVDDIPSAGPADPAPDAVDASEGEVLSFLSGKLSEEDLETVRGMLSGSEAPAAPMAGDEKDKADKDGKDKPAQDAAPKAPDMKNYVSRPAMDSAIAKAVKDATAAAAESHRKLRDTEQFCRKHAGELPAMDSEEDYLRAACDVKGIDHRGVQTSALRPLIEVAAKFESKAPKAAPRTVAQDAASRSEAEKLFPHMNRLGA